MKCLCIALALVSTAGAGCPPEYPFQYLDRSHGFQICLPAGIKSGVTDDPKGATPFTGFAVPAKTNLEKKELIIVSGDYYALKSAEPFGQFTANGVTFKRSKFPDGALGRLALHVIYTPASSGDASPVSS